MLPIIHLPMPRIRNIIDGTQGVPGTLDELFREATPFGALGLETGEILISNVFDSEWADYLDITNSFNTVWKPVVFKPVQSPFEVISIIDVRTPAATTQNYNAYFFSYNPIVSLYDWISYIESIKGEYNKTIDRLVIYAHGYIGSLTLSDGSGGKLSTSDLLKNRTVRKALQKLGKSLNPDGSSHILLFSCLTGADETFIREMAKLTHAWVHANTDYTGPPESAPWFRCENNSPNCVDWQLDIVCSPDGIACFYDKPW